MLRRISKSKFSITATFVGFFALSLGFCDTRCSAQAIAGQPAQVGIDDSGLVLSRLNDFVIKPGKAQPANEFPSEFPSTRRPVGQPSADNPSQLIPQPTQPARLGQSGVVQSLPPSMPPNGGQPHVRTVGLARQGLSGNAQLGGGPQWQILQNPNGPHTAILFDPNRQVIAVYQIDSASGAITLKSVRNVSWDLQIEDYNSNKPAPQDIRSMQP